MLLFESRCNIRKKQLLDGKTFIDTLFLLLLFFIMGTRGRSHLFPVSIDYKVPRNPSNIAFFFDSLSLERDTASAQTCCHFNPT